MNQTVRIPEKLEKKPPSWFRPYAGNARTHSAEQVTQLVKSILEFGWTNPVLATPDGDVIAGHGRLEAAKALSLTEVPVVILDGLTDDQRRALVLADNKLALNAGWDFGILREELLLLDQANFDVELTGFVDAELEDIMTWTAPEAELPNLPSGDRSALQQMTFILHQDQIASIKEAMSVARKLGPFVDTGNENGNGNALARVCETFLSQNGNR